MSAVRNLGGEVVLHGDDYDSAYEHAQSIVRERNLAFVHPFDDPDVIAGQGTIAVEILRQSRGDLDAIFVPVGGGGLISGIAVYAKYLNPKIRIIGVEPVDAAAMHDSLRAKKRVTLERVGIFADGVAVQAGRRRNLPPVPRTRRRNRAGGHRRDLRRHPGRLRRHALHRRRRGRARGGGPQEVLRAATTGRTSASSPSTAAPT